jgi:hypothetical protein
MDRNVALSLTISPEDLLMQYSYAAPRFGLVLMGVFASVGLALVTLISSIFRSLPRQFDHRSRNI